MRFADNKPLREGSTSQHRASGLVQVTIVTAPTWFSDLLVLKVDGSTCGTALSSLTVTAFEVSLK
jgi:hypothetical protein